MELKAYQQKVMDDLSSYIDAVDSTNDLKKGWGKYWEAKDIHVGPGGVPQYHNRISQTPHVCMKVPTGGGKTFMACCAVKKICDHLPLEKPKIVVWLVPSDAILSQTYRSLSDINHPYRQRLDRDFAGRVGVYTKDMLLNGQNFSPDTVQDMLTVCVLSYASLRIDSKKKDVRKVYQENGNLFRFADYFDDKSVLLADTPETALIQILRYLNPVTIVDESHNAESKLSTDMLNNLNPSFILELTATPRESSNIISYVDARELKKENMVKLPVIVFNRNNRQMVIQDAIQLRENLETAALQEQKTSGTYIRPIVLFQAQPHFDDDSSTFENIKNMLLQIGIPENQIAIKTASKDDLKNTDLMSFDCPIRYIITVNALKEGWDCPFAYILASLANKTSKVDVEQILGRILRQPYTQKHESPLLNMSYVLTSSYDFQHTLDSVVTALNNAGFSKKDYRVGEDVPAINTPVPDIPGIPVQQTLTPEQLSGSNINGVENSSGTGADTFDDINTDQIVSSIANEKNESGFDDNLGNTPLSSMVSQAISQGEDYQRQVENASNDSQIGGEMGDMLNQYRIQEQYREEVKDLKIPQFFIEGAGDLFSSGYDLLEPDNLTEGFTLSNQDAQVNFELSTGEVYRVDILSEGEAVPKYMQVKESDKQRLQQYFERLAKPKQREACVDLIATQLNKNNRWSTPDIQNYVRRVIGHLSDDQIELIRTSYISYAAKIQQKIEQLENTYRIKKFQTWIDSGKIVCKPNYQLPEIITPADAIDSIPYSLYEAEKKEFNGLERDVINAVVGTGKIRWWHRIIDRKGFRINGYINHYPDFMIMTKSRRLLMVEAKGEQLTNEDSRNKLSLGRKWQSLAGPKYGYYMVFRDKAPEDDGAYTLDRFTQLLKDM